MTAIQCIQVCKHGQNDALKLKLNIKMSKEGDFGVFERGMVDGARCPGPIISETPRLGVSPHKIPAWITQNGLKKIKYPVNGSSLGEKASLMPDVRGELPGCLKLIGMTTCNNYAKQKSISE